MLRKAEIQAALTYLSGDNTKSKSLTHTHYGLETRKAWTGWQKQDGVQSRDSEAGTEHRILTHKH